MKKKVLATKMAAFVMAGAMTMAMGFPALAVEASAKKTVSLTKKVTTDGKTYAPNATFGFEISSKTINETNGIDKTGVTGGLSFATTHTQKGSVAFVPEVKVGETIVEPKAEYTQELGLEIVQNKFSAPGRYHYEIKEIKGTHDGVTYSEATNDVIVYVYDNGAGGYTYALSNTVIEEKGDQESEAAYKERLERAKNNIEFINTYGSGDTTSTLKDLTITKVIAGDFASPNDSFEISVNVTGNAGEYYLVEYKENTDDASKKDALVSGENKKFSIKATGEIVVHGITPNANVKVEETNPGAGYKAKYEITTEGVDTSNCNVDSGYNGKLPNAGVKNIALKITNTKNAVTPTGIVTEYAPYILLVAAAGTFAVLFLRKRKEEF